MNGDVAIYVDGAAVHTLKQTDWNPDNIVEEMRLVIDLSLDVPKYGEPALDAAASVEAAIDYVAVWKLNCGVSTSYAPTSTGKWRCSISAKLNILQYPTDSSSKQNAV